MVRTTKGVHQPISKLPAASAAAATDIIRSDQGGLDEVKMTLAQLATFLSTNLGTATFDDITVSTVTLTDLIAGGSAMTFTVTGQTSGAIAAVTSNSNSFGFATKGQIEFIIETVKNNKAAIDELRS